MTCVRHITPRTGRPSKMTRPHLPVDGKYIDVARIAWEQHHGKPLGELHIHHRCLNSWCVNPEHLQAVTASEHWLIHQALETHCRGEAEQHVRTPENTRLDPAGKRHCRDCHRIKMQTYRAKRAERDGADWRKQFNQ